MKVILKQDVVNLGEEGDVCEVARGYARNYLVPQGYAMLYNRANMTLIEGRRNAIEQRKEDKRKAALEISERLAEEELLFSMNAGENGKLFGAVTSAMIAEELAKKGIVVERKKVDVPDGTIKAVGKYKVGLKLYGDKEAEIKVNVVAANAPQRSTASSERPTAADRVAPTETESAEGATAEVAPDEVTGQRAESAEEPLPGGDSATEVAEAAETEAAGTEAAEAETAETETTGAEAAETEAAEAADPEADEKRSS